MTTVVPTATPITNLQGIAYKNFINAIRSCTTRMGYINSLKRYMNHLQLKEVDDLMLPASAPRLIESQIIDFIRYGISSS
jgi:hypothetical protein